MSELRICFSTSDVFTELGRLIAPLAQLVERLPYMQDVGGSNPSGCTKEQVPVSRKGVSENRLSARSMKQMIRVGKLRSRWMN